MFLILCNNLVVKGILIYQLIVRRCIYCFGVFYLNWISLTIYCRIEKCLEKRRLRIQGSDLKNHKYSFPYPFFL